MKKYLPPLVSLTVMERTPSCMTKAIEPEIL